MTVNPKTIDTSAAPATMTVRLRVTDEQGDTRMTSMTVRYANGSQIRDVYYENWRLVSGDGFDGIYEAALTMPRHSAQGFWQFNNVKLGDEANNYRYEFPAELSDAEFDDGFSQTGPGDAAVPKLVSLSINPAVVDGSAPSPTVTITARLTDPIAGVPLTSDDRAPGGMAIVTSPSGADLWARFDYSTVSSGDLHDAVFTPVLTLPANPERGTWRIRQVHVGDLVGNQGNLWPADLAAAGFPSSFEVR